MKCIYRDVLGAADTKDNGAQKSAVGQHDSQLNPLLSKSPIKVHGRQDDSSNDDDHSDRSQSPGVDMSKGTRLVGTDHSKESRSIYLEKDLRSGGRQETEENRIVHMANMAEKRSVHLSMMDDDSYKRDRVQVSKIQYDLAEQEDPIRASPLRKDSSLPKSRDSPNYRSDASSKSSELSPDSDSSDSVRSKEGQRRTVKKVEVNVKDFLRLVCIFKHCIFCCWVW